MRVWKKDRDIFQEWLATCVPPCWNGNRSIIKQRSESANRVSFRCHVRHALAPSNQYLISNSGRENLLRRASSAGDCAMNCAVVAGDIRRFAGKEQSLPQWSTQCLLASLTSGFHITVSATRERVGIPVVKVCGDQQRLNLRFLNLQQCA